MATGTIRISTDQASASGVNVFDATPVVMSR
jgi:hypothetical protein